LSLLSNPVVISLTVDPNLFPSPKAAYDYLNKKIAVFVQTLKRQNLLDDDRWAAVMEAHYETRFPHYHLIVSTKLPFWAPDPISPNVHYANDLIQDLWGKLRPEWAPPPMDGRPAFGKLMVTMAGNDISRGENLIRAINYIVKPDSIIPDWMRDMGGRNGKLSLIKKSRKVTTRKKQAMKAKPNSLTVQNVYPTQTTSQNSSSKRQMTYREKVVTCGQQAIMLRAKQYDLGDWIRNEYRYIASFNLNETDLNQFEKVGLVDEDGWVEEWAKTLPEFMALASEVTQRQVRPLGGWYDEGSPSGQR
jgi:hypothetical protein